ncbi:hypothetical protein BK133_11285 [Paenibacillus sp. FSL H8-0548]|uniref:hypothetical protein n=1 Tax=Paenibacillus sp. FSL H8-0548 TaxID=1920422 RepID=UPI00096F57CA|nr:hypothetical protein [Paenibacillus sp. FSL H8-0548]OMF35279.1 hypothetical protein BK133_11285 [Paenibacillus sp. FSL H8-0548]
MALKISKNVGLTDIVSDVNPITTEHPITGSAVAVQLWLFNDAADKRYEDVLIDPTDAVSTDESTWVQLAPDNDGVAGTYLAGGAALTMANISDSDVANPFWMKVTTPAVGDTQNKTDIKLTVTAKEFAV